MAQDRYAYGESKVYGTRCVARVHASGADIGEELLTVAEKYDQLARDKFVDTKGVISSSTAEELWNEAIEKIRRRLHDEQDDEHAKYLRRAINKGEEIQAKAF